jgi:hypothetical protein
MTYRLAWRVLHSRSRRVPIDRRRREEDENRRSAGRGTRIEQFLQQGKVGDPFDARHLLGSQRNCAPAKVKNDIEGSEGSRLRQKRGRLKAVATLAREGHHLRLG